MRWMLGVFAIALLSPATVYARDVAPLTVSSPAFTNGGMIPRDYTCEGRSVSPPISWSAVPSGTKSVAVIVDDPDAPRGTFEHLVLFNLPPSERSLTSMGGSLAGTNGLMARNSTVVVGPASRRSARRADVITIASRCWRSTRRCRKRPERVPPTSRTRLRATFWRAAS